MTRVVSGVLGSVGLAIVLVVPASCGSRTGLLVSDIPAASSADDGSVADAAPETSLACTPGPIALTAAQPEVMFVLDRSGSMSTAFQGNASRWQTLTTSLAATLPSVNGTMAIGALLFPSSTTSHDDCTVTSSASLSPALDHVPSLLTILESTSPGGATPTADAIDVAAGLMLGVRAATTARALVLATDGAPNCNSSLNAQSCTCASANGNGCQNDADQCLDETRTVARITAASTEGIPTYVIGIADSDDNLFSGVLDAMAVAGGRPLTGSTTSYYPARSQSDLETAIETIRDQVGGCTYLTTSVPSAGGSIVLTLNGVTVPYDPTGTNGWSWANEANGQIVLYGATCASVAGTANASIVAYVTCGSDGGADAEAGSDAAADATLDATTSDAADATADADSD